MVGYQHMVTTIQDPTYLARLIKGGRPYSPKHVEPDMGPGNVDGLGSREYPIAIHLGLQHPDDLSPL